MAYINVAEWSADQVTDWLKGLDVSMYNYVGSFTNNEVGGRQLLNIRPYELEQLGIKKIGHQEIVLEAVENLRNFHYNLDKENLQFLALHVATAAGNLRRQLTAHSDASKIETQILNDITRTIALIKPLVGWLDRAPFHGQLQFIELRKNLLKLGLEMATVAQRDRFVERPAEQLRTTAEKLERLGDYVIQDITDPMILQPASLNLVTLKKRETGLGFDIEPNYHGVHRVSQIKQNSPAHNAGKIEDGDEIVQINYQTVVGWQYKTVLMQLHELQPDVLLTLKKRPKHMKIYGQIYMQPYRLPSKKRAMTSRWGDNLPSPRAGFLTVPEGNVVGVNTANGSGGAGATGVAMGGMGPGAIRPAIGTAGSLAGPVACNVSSSDGIGSTFALPSLKASDEKLAAAAVSDSDSSCSDILTPTDGDKDGEKERRMYQPKPRTMLQRRNTICGDEMFSTRERNANGAAPFWHKRKTGAGCGGGVAGTGELPASPSLRDKSVSFGFGLDAAPRPTTYAGLATTGGGIFSETVKRLRQVPEQVSAAAEGAAQTSSTMTAATTPTSAAALERSKPGVSKVVRFDANMRYEDYPVDAKYLCNVENTILETFEPIPYADEEDEDALNALRSSVIAISEDAAELSERDDVLSTLAEAVGHSGGAIRLAEAVNMPLVARRGRLDKSHSTPAYDNSGEESEDTPPPAIEPRKEFMVQTPPPVPPPRPRKHRDLTPPAVPPPPPKPPGLKLSLAAAAAAASSAQVTSHAAGECAGGDESMKPPATLPISLMSAMEGHASSAPPAVLPTSATTPGDTSELLTPTKSRILTLKKKHSLIAKRRNVNLKLLGTGEIQGHLYRRTKDRRGVTFWARLYFVMLDTILYGFRSKEAGKANCVIFLPGFTVAKAKEVHSKPFAFKVYHAAKTFYFATDSNDALTQWIDFIRNAAQQMQPVTGRGHVQSDPLAASAVDTHTRDLYSETDSSGEDCESLVSGNLCTPSPQQGSVGGLGMEFGSLCGAPSPNVQSALAATTMPGLVGGAAYSNTPTSSHSSSGGGGKPDRRYLGSLRKLTKGTLPFKSSAASERKLPVPTDQYRSYRKAPGGSFGIQIGTATPGYHDAPPLPTTSIPPPLPLHAGQVNNGYPARESASSQPHTPVGTPATLTLSSSRSSIVSNGAAGPLSEHPFHHHVPPASPAPLAAPTTPLAVPTVSIPSLSTLHILSTQSSIDTPSFASITTTNTNADSLSPSAAYGEDDGGSVCGGTASSADVLSPGGSIPYNFIHASNPNLVEFDFQTSKTLDYALPKISAAQAWDAHPSPVQGFVTLKDLMLRKQEEEAQEMYNNRVLLGVEKKDERRRCSANFGGSSSVVSASSCRPARHSDAPGYGAMMGADGGLAYRIGSVGGGGAVAHAVPPLPISGKVAKTQSRSLPKTPDYEISFKPDDEDIRRTRTKEGLKLRDFGYELISGDEPLGGSGHHHQQHSHHQHHSQQTAAAVTPTAHEHGWMVAMTSRQLLKTQQFLLSGHKKKHSSSSCSSASGEFAEKRAGSLKKKAGGKLEALKTSSEQLFQFNSGGSGSSKHSSSSSMMTMTLPLNRKAQRNDSASSGGASGAGAGIKKSHTYNHDLKEKAGAGKYEAYRKNSAPMPTFTKLSFIGGGGGTGGNNYSSNNNNNSNNGSNKTPKEKRILGSPLLRRAFFGSGGGGGASGNQHPPTIPLTPPIGTATCKGREYDREIFSQVIFSKKPTGHHGHGHAYEHGHYGHQQQAPARPPPAVTASPRASLTAPEVDAPPPPVQTAPTLPPPPPQAATPQHAETPPAAGNTADSGGGGGAAAASAATPPEYPHMECPPVFEPEIYSLTDTDASLTLLLRRNTEVNAGVANTPGTPSASEH